MLPRNRHLVLLLSTPHQYLFNSFSTLDTSLVLLLVKIPLHDPAVGLPLLSTDHIVRS